MAKGWLDNYGKEDNYNDSNVSAPEGFRGDGYSNVGRNYSPAWGGQFQMGGSVYPVNYVPQAQIGKKVKKAKEKELEDYVDEFLGHPQEGARYMSDINPDEDPIDNIRHSFAGRYTQDAISKRLGNGVMANVAGLVGSNLMGAAHEISTLGKDDRPWMTKLKESGEDMFNNAVGSVIGAIPYMDEKAKDKMMYKMSYGNLLPDGYVSTEKGKKKGQSDNIYFKNQKGEVKRKYQMGGNLSGATGHMYARIGAPSNGKYAKHTLASAENGAWLDDYDVAQTGINASKFKEFGKSNSPQSKLQRSTTKEEASEDYRRWTDSSEYKNQVRSNKLAEDKATVKGRKDRINKSMAAQKKSFTKDNWRQQLADETQAIGDKFRIFPEDPDSFIDEWMNPGVLLGDMASDLGSAPLRAQQEDSYMPYVTSVGVPLLTGGLEGIGAKTTGQFISNVVNPLNVVPGYNSVEQVLPGMLKKGINSTKKGLAKGALTTLETLRDIHDLGKQTARGIDERIIYPIQYKKEIKQIKDLHNNLRNTIGLDESGKRLQNTLGIDPNNIDYPSITTAPMGSHYDSFLNNVNMDLRQINRLKKEKELMLSAEATHSHEMGHWMGREAYRQGPEYKKALSDYEEELAKYNSQENKELNDLDLSDDNPDNIRNWFRNAIKVKPMRPLAYTAPTKIDEYAKRLYGYDYGTNMIDIDHMINNSGINDVAISNAKYFTHRGVEPIAHLREMRQNMLEKGAIDNIYDPISNATIAKFIKENPTDRISSFTKDDYDKISGLGSIFRRLPSVVGAGAISAAAVEQQRDGGIIKDDMGQWAHPGEITEINSTDITMEGVPYDVLGISDTGDTKLMKPGKNYKFKGKKVTEYPMAQNGIKQELNTVVKDNTSVYKKERKKDKVIVPGTPVVPVSKGNWLNKLITENITPYGYLMGDPSTMAPNKQLDDIVWESSNKIKKLNDKYGYKIEKNESIETYSGERFNHKYTKINNPDLYKKESKKIRDDRNKKLLSITKNISDNKLSGKLKGTPRPERLNASQDALNLHQGIPQKYNSFVYSNYKPSNSKESSQYYSLAPQYEDEIRQDLFERRNADFINSKDKFRQVKGSHIADASLKDYQYSKGKDEKGDYIAYYDVNDYGNILDVLPNSNPFEIYGRIYYDKKTGKPITKHKDGGSINQQDGKSLQQLDQLTNFTNYNTKQPGGWMDQI